MNNKAIFDMRRYIVLFRHNQKESAEQYREKCKKSERYKEFSLGDAFKRPTHIMVAIKQQGATVATASNAGFIILPLSSESVRAAPVFGRPCITASENGVRFSSSDWFTSIFGWVRRAVTPPKLPLAAVPRSGVSPYSSACNVGMSKKQGGDV